MTPLTPREPGAAWGRVGALALGVLSLLPLGCAEDAAHDAATCDRCDGAASDTRDALADDITDKGPDADDAPEDVDDRDAEEVPPDGALPDVPDASREDATPDVDDGSLDVPDDVALDVLDDAALDVLDDAALDGTDDGGDVAVDAPHDVGPELPAVDAPDGARCAAGSSACGDAGCVDLRVRDDHCGRCGNACPPAHACVRGACRLACPAPLVACATPAGERCVDLATDAAHCGACGSACAAVQGASPTCREGGCGFTCDPGRADCNGAPRDGCETALATTVAHCGRCDNACPSAPRATATCAAGVCGRVCRPGWEDCDRRSGNGCEVDVRSTPSHCGGCGRACAPSANAVAECNAGRCDARCLSGWGDCNASRADGCETNLAAATAHCGACGRACAPLPHARAACAAGACALGLCEAPWADCDGDPSNGCEVDTSATVAHCGACGRRCASGTCEGGRCVPPPPTQRSCTGTPRPPGCGLVQVIGGRFDMGAPRCLDPMTPTSTCANAIMERPGVSVSSFAMDAYEVTNGRYRAFWQARTTTAAPSALRASPIRFRGGRVMPWGDRADHVAPPDPGPEDAHAVALGYWAAQEFCAWDGGRLATEAEWEYAARGRAVDGLAPGRVYPWGNADPSPSCDRAHWNQCPGVDGRPTRPVDAFAPSGGIFGLSGGLSEWIADTPYAADGCLTAVDPVCTAMPPIGDYRMFRGGAYYDTLAVSLRAASNNLFVYAVSRLGVRCVHELP